MTFLTGLALGAFLSASAADGITTHGALSRGGVERNPVLANEAVMIGVKAGSAGLMAVAAARWEKQHPKATRILLIVGAGAYTAIAVHNSQVGRQR